MKFNDISKDFPLDKSQNVDSIDSVKISLASPELIKAWSYGEVKKPETINYRTFKPERGGLFCAQIFGPTKDYTCICGKYKRMKHRGIVCDKCGVEITKSVVRRERMGHIELEVPVAHIWFLRSLPGRIPTILDMKTKDVESIIYFDQNIVVDGGDTEVETGSILTQAQTAELEDKYGDRLCIGSGAESLRKMLEHMDLDIEISRIDVQINKTRSILKLKKLQKRRKIFVDLLQSGQRPEWMILTRLPVIAPDLRPLIELDGGRFASSDLNDLYRHILNRNTRLKRLKLLSAPDIILRNEKRMLQEAVDALIDNEKSYKVFMNNNRALKSLSNTLKGKSGRFRQNILGKRVDYSARSVITVGPKLRFFECGIPKDIALELFKPFVFYELQKRGLVGNIKSAQRMVERRDPQVWDILSKVVYQHPVLLNRAPTLHSLGIQAFEPKLIDGKSIQLHPLLCSPFNADFDGDSMAVHLPLSLEAQAEARILMMSTNNIRKPSTGEPSINHSQDILLGLYHASLESDGVAGEHKLYDGYEGVKRAYDAKKLHLQARIRARVKGKIYDTTAGRVLLSPCLCADIPFSSINKVIDNKVTKNLIAETYEKYDNKEAVIFMDQLMQLGFYYVTKSGISISLSDMVTVPTKPQIIKDASEKALKNTNMHKKGIIDASELFARNVGIWTDTNNKLKEELQDRLSKDKNGQNPIYSMIKSGARGSINQLHQIGGMRGLMSKPGGKIIDIPIKANFKEGISCLEYFISISGSRKGLIDTSLNTATAGYLTRRLVDAGQYITITSKDCGTENSITLLNVYKDGNLIIDIRTRLLGRVIAESLSLLNGVVIPSGTLITKNHVKQMQEFEISSAKIYSVPTCDEPYGVCTKCYGSNISTGEAVSLGCPVGILAAQSIGEPGTQLTLRTVHSGGIALGLKGKSQCKYFSHCDGILDIHPSSLLTGSDGKAYVVSNSHKIRIWNYNKDTILEEFVAEKGAEIAYKDGDKVNEGDKILEWSPIKPILSRYAGKVSFKKFTSANVESAVDPILGLSFLTVVDNLLSPAIEVVSPSGTKHSYLLEKNASVYISDGSNVKVGDIVFYVPRRSQTNIKSKDIVGGLGDMVNVFEARFHNDHMVRSPTEGTIVSISPDRRGNAKVQIVEKDTDKTISISLDAEKELLVSEGDKVKMGDIISSGPENLQDMLDIFGIGHLTCSIVDEMQTLFEENGIYVHEKHIETIIKAMTQQSIVTKSHDIAYLQNDVANTSVLKSHNDKLLQNGKEPMEYRRIIKGITRAALDSTSFLSAASFQESDKILIEAAIAGRVDKLRGIKESIIVGKKMPAGTNTPGIIAKAKGILNTMSDNKDYEDQRDLVE